MIDASNYTITIRKGCFEGEICFEARIAELPDVAEYADSFEEAYALAIDTIEVTAELLAEQGKQMPLPMIPADDYSGRITLRLPKRLHRELAKAADVDGVSLNQHIITTLSYCTGYTHATKQPSFQNIWQPTLLENTPNKPQLKLVSSSKPTQYLEDKYERCVNEC